MASLCLRTLCPLFSCFFSVFPTLFACVKGDYLIYSYLSKCHANETPNKFKRAKAETERAPPASSTGLVSPDKQIDCQTSVKQKNKMINRPQNRARFKNTTADWKDLARALSLGINTLHTRRTNAASRIKIQTVGCSRVASTSKTPSHRWTKSC